jgi:hypothetical protein
MNPSRQEKAARLGSRGGRNGTLTRRKTYPTRTTSARPNVEAWRPVHIGKIVEKLLGNNFAIAGAR